MRCLPVTSFFSNILFFLFFFFFIGKILFVCDGDSGDSTKTTYTCPPAVTYMFVYINSHIYIWCFDLWYNVDAGSHRQVYASPLKPAYEKLYRKMSSVFHILQENLRILVLNRYTNCKLFELWLDGSCKSVLRHEHVEFPCLCFIIFWSLYVIQCLYSVLECAKNDVSHAERRLTGHDTFLKRCNEEIQTDGNARKRFFIPHFTLFFFSFFLLFTTNVTRYIMAHSMAVATMYFNKRFTFFLLFFLNNLY